MRQGGESLQGKQTPRDVRDAIAYMGGQLGMDPVAIVESLRKTPALANWVPQDLRTIRKYMRRDTGARWALRDSSPEDAAVVLEALRHVIELSEDEGFKRSITKAEAEWLVRVRRVAPDLKIGEALVVAEVYLARELANDTDTSDVDAYLAFAPWRDEESLKTYLDGLERGWFGRVPVLFTFTPVPGQPRTFSVGHFVPVLWNIAGLSSFHPPHYVEELDLKTLRFIRREPTPEEMVEMQNLNKKEARSRKELGSEEKAAALADVEAELPAQRTLVEAEIADLQRLFEEVRIAYARTKSMESQAGKENVAQIVEATARELEMSEAGVIWVLEQIGEMGDA